MGKISSAEIADIMLRQEIPLTVTEVTRIAAKEYPQLLVTRQSVTNIIRHFVRSPHAVCDAEHGVYPHRYRLHGLHGYQFKVRGRVPDFACLLVGNTSRAILERKERERRELVAFANHFWNNCAKSRKESA